LRGSSRVGCPWAGQCRSPRPLTAGPGVPTLPITVNTAVATNSATRALDPLLLRGGGHKSRGVLLTTPRSAPTALRMRTCNVRVCMPPPPRHCLLCADFIFP